MATAKVTFSFNNVTYLKGSIVLESIVSKYPNLCEKEKEKVEAKTSKEKVEMKATKEKKEHGKL